MIALMLRYEEIMTATKTRTYNAATLRYREHILQIICFLICLPILDPRLEAGFYELSAHPSVRNALFSETAY